MTHLFCAMNDLHRLCGMTVESKTRDPDLSATGMSLEVVSYSVATFTLICKLPRLQLAKLPMPMPLAPVPLQQRSVMGFTSCLSPLTSATVCHIRRYCILFPHTARLSLTLCRLIVKSVFSDILIISSDGSTICKSPDFGLRLLKDLNLEEDNYSVVWTRGLFAPVEYANPYKHISSTLKLRLYYRRHRNLGPRKQQQASVS